MDHGVDSEHSHSHSDSSPEISWTDHHYHQPYPHSYHGTPAHEYPRFTWSQAGVPYNVSHVAPIDERLQNPMLLQYVPPPMPAWPSMLATSQDHSRAQSLPQPPLLMTMYSAPAVPQMAPTTSTKSKTGTILPRRTLTDEDRRRMCLYAEQYPSLKQIDIGAQFGVDRSTVSKVLSRKDQYLPRSPKPARAPPRPKLRRTTELENTLTAWAKKQLEHGEELTDESIRERCAVLASTSRNPGPNPADNATWLEDFKFRIRSMIRSSRTNTPAPTTAPTLSSVGPSRSTPVSMPSPRTPISASSDMPAIDPRLREIKSEEDFRGIQTFVGTGRSASMQALQSTPRSFTNARLPSVTAESSPIPFIEPSAYFTPTSAAEHPYYTLVSPSVQRPRSATFPTLDFNPLLSASESSQPLFVETAILDSPMSDQEGQGQRTEGFTPINRPETVSPSEITKVPIYPNRAKRESTIEKYKATASSSLTKPDEGEAHEALELVMRNVQSQPQGLLTTQESMLMGRMLERIGHSDVPQPPRARVSPQSGQEPQEPQQEQQQKPRKPQHSKKHSKKRST